MCFRERLQRVTSRHLTSDGSIGCYAELSGQSSLNFAKSLFERLLLSRAAIRSGSWCPSPNGQKRPLVHRSSVSAYCSGGALLTEILSCILRQILSTGCALLSWTLWKSLLCELRSCPRLRFAPVQVVYSAGQKNLLLLQRVHSFTRSPNA